MWVVGLSGTSLSGKYVSYTEVSFRELRCLVWLVCNWDVAKSESGELPNLKLGCREIGNWGVAKSEVGVLAIRIVIVV